MNEIITDENLKLQIRCVSHEIRNHLSICDMYSQIIRKNLEKSKIENPSIENALDCIQKSIQIIGTNLLDLKSLNSTTERIYDFKAILEKGVELSKVYANEEKNIEFEVFIKNTSNIKIDENRFLSCIVNIIKNAIEATELNGEPRKNHKDKQENIFNEGYTTKKTGCGLGLCICKKYLKSQNATLELVKSIKGQTQFEIKIPITTYSTKEENPE